MNWLQFANMSIIVILVFKMLFCMFDIIATWERLTKTTDVFEGMQKAKWHNKALDHYWGTVFLLAVFIPLYIIHFN